MSQPQRGLATTANSNALALSDSELIAVLRSSIYPGATDASIKMIISYCSAAGLDPMLKPVHIVPMNVKKPGSRDTEWRDVVMPGIGLYRIQATRTGQYLGKTEPEFGPDITRKLGGKEVTFPQWCRVTVRKSVGHAVAEFAAKELWVENYATAGKDTEAPNAMWGKRPYGQLAKVAEAQALRQAFPELLGGTNTADEMEGKSLDEGREMVDITPAAKPSAAKAALDNFAGKPKEAAQAAHAPFYDPVAEDDPFAATDDETGEIVTMPQEAAEAFRDSGKWMAAWKWLSMTLPEQSKPVAMALVKEHWPVLQMVAKYRDTYKKSVNDLLTLCDTGLTIDAEAA